MRLAAIPKSLLPSTIEVRVPADGEYGGCYEEPVTIDHIRFDAAATIKPDQYTFSPGSKGLIFIDALNSEGAFELPVGTLVTIYGEELSVVTVNTYCGYNGQVHHWEVEVA